jgi:N-acetylglutamate synthase-like GNAT family acetyltransferase
VVTIARAKRPDAAWRERVTFRNATPADADALVQLINAAYDRTEHLIFLGSRRTERHDIGQLIGGIVVAEQEGRIAGCVHIDAASDPAHYGLLAVDVSQHRSGLGSMLVEHAETVAREAGATAVSIETVKQAGLMPFYERRGYVLVGETDGQVWNGGADWGAAGPWQMVDMKKDLR